MVWFLAAIADPFATDHATAALVATISEDSIPNKHNQTEFRD